MIILGITSSSDKNAPTAPTIGTATNVGTGRAYNNGAATVTFTPGSAGGLPVTYTATSSPGGFTASGSSSPLTVTGLQSNTAYTFTVTATNSLGSATSAASNSITATTVPQAPTIGTATDGGTGTTVSVAFTPGATGGSAITTYTATSSPGSITGTGASSPITVSGLTTGQAYTFTVTATNANGTSQASAASNSVTPAVPGSYESITSITPSGVGKVVITNIPQTFTHLQVRFVGRTTYNAYNQTGAMRLNDDSGANPYNYVEAYINGNNSTVNPNYSTDNGVKFQIWGNAITANQYGVAVADILDYTTTNKKKQVRFSSCVSDSGGATYMLMTITHTDWANTSAITSLAFQPQNDNWAAGTTIAIYGIKG